MTTLTKCKQYAKQSALFAVLPTDETHVIIHSPGFVTGISRKVDRGYTLLLISDVKDWPYEIDSHFNLKGKKIS